MRNAASFIIFTHVISLIIVLFSSVMFEKKYLLYSALNNVISLATIIYMTYNKLKVVDITFLFLLIGSSILICLSVSSLIYKKIVSTIILTTVICSAIIFIVFLFFSNELVIIFLLRSCLCLYIYFGLSVSILKRTKHEEKNLYIVGYGLFGISVIDITNILYIILSKTQGINRINLFIFDIESIVIPIILILYEYRIFYEKSQVVKQSLSEMKESNKSKHEYMVNISHELRTPINVIINTLILIEFNMKSENTKNPDKIQEYSLTLRKNLNRLMKLINNFKANDEIGKGELSCKYELCEILSFVKEVVTSTRTYGENKSLSIDFVSEMKETYIFIDLEKIERVILNLVSNAIKFTRTCGKIEVKVWDNDQSIMISVIDNGIGIPEDKQNKIFDKFGQVDNELVRKSEGCGIGLFLVKAFVELHNGSLSVNSKLGEGSNFTFSLPKSFYPPNIQDYIEKSSFNSLQIELSDIS